MRKHMSFRGRTAVVIVVFFAAVFALAASRSGDLHLWLLAAAVPGAALVILLLPSSLLFLDRPSLAAAVTLCGFGLMADALLSSGAVFSRAVYYAGALVFLLCGAVFIRVYRVSFPSSVIIAATALGMISVPLWLSGLFSLTGGGILLLLVAAASFLSLRMYLPALGSVLCGILFLLMQQEFSGSAVLCLSGLILFWVSSGSGLWSCIAFITMIGMPAVYTWLFLPLSSESHGSVLSHLTALTLLAPEAPAESADPVSGSLFILLGEQFGLVFLFFSLLLLCTLMVRGSVIAQEARKPFHASAAFCAVLFFGLRVLFFILSVADILPLPAVELPLLTGSLPDLCADFFLLGLLSGVAYRNESDLQEDARLSMLAR